MLTLEELEILNNGTDEEKLNLRLRIMFVFYNESSNI